MTRKDILKKRDQMKAQATFGSDIHLSAPDVQLAVWAYNKAIEDVLGLELLMPDDIESLKIE